MRTPFLHTVALLALSLCSALALAQAPARVGRLSLSQGEVAVSAEAGQEAAPALVNWPLTSHNQLTTGRDARTEFRVGSSAVRLDGDSKLEIVELDDDSLRMYLHYGSASIRIRDPETLRGFELSTPQGRVRMQQPGRVRVEAERVRGTSMVSVFEGAAQVEGGGAALTVRAGKRAELRPDDVRTAFAVSDSFDDWALLRDQRDERATSTRYVSTDMTGYEELDQYGTWRDDAEYGPLWRPRSVPSGWAPYRDGSWTWVAPWGWTWVDHAPWGYAPFHYGRWVHVDQRWYWTPGRNVGRPVWAPALVGWIGGNGWSLTFGSYGTQRQAPAQGWYPLSPQDTFVPGYRVSPEHLNRINAWDRRHADHRPRDRDHRHEGLTVVPQDQFGQRGTIVVPRAPKVITPSVALDNAPVAVPPAPPPLVVRTAPRELAIDPRDRFERDGQRPGRGQRREQGVVVTAPPVAPLPPAAGQQPVIISTQPAPGAPVPMLQREQRGQFDDARRVRPTPQPAPPVAMPAPVLVAPMTAPRPVAEPMQGQPHAERFNRGQRDERRREPEFEAQRMQHQGAPVMRAAPQPAPVFQAPPQAPAARQAAPAQAPAAQAPANQDAAKAERQRRIDERKEGADRR